MRLVIVILLLLKIVANNQLTFFYQIIYSVRLEQGTVTSLIEENGSVKGVQYKTKAGQEIKAHAPLTVVCDGCFSNLRRSLCDPKVKLIPLNMSVDLFL